MPSKITQPCRIKVATEADFEDFRQLFNEEDASFQLKHDKRGVRVWSQTTKDSPVKLIRMIVEKIPVAAATIFDVFHDEGFRPSWDKHMLASKDHCRLDNNNDIGYYALRCPAPLKDRDMVMQRSWFVSEDSSEYVIFNRSVVHKDFPPQRKFIRAVSLITGYYIKRIDDESCWFGYASQSDPLGNIPKMIVNMFATSTVPKTVQDLVKAGQKYPAWKEKNQPDFKPWLNPDQSKLPLLKPEDYAMVEGSDEDAAKQAEEAATTAQEAEADIDENTVIEVDPDSTPPSPTKKNSTSAL